MPSPGRFSKPEMDTGWATAAEIAAAVTSGRVSATEVVQDALARITKRDPVLNSESCGIIGRHAKERRLLERSLEIIPGGQVIGGEPLDHARDVTRHNRVLAPNCAGSSVHENI